ncbi:winged helix-turn-helix transcriptional regulator [Streptomyces sp. NPDC096311]|uniref:winged helix-turn-helix transcriptional regulator n=1 Tax=Streptomyces sp. NPDC096311 TaxID=3366083 RepID=UPI0037F9DAAC
MPELWCLLRDGRLRFTDLRRRLPQVGAKLLAQRLRQLERHGFMTRTSYGRCRRGSSARPGPGRVAGSRVRRVRGVVRAAYHRGRGGPRRLYGPVGLKVEGPPSERCTFVGQ